MKPPSFVWPNTAAARDTLFFAQALEALLDEKSFEGFRFYSLDSQARILEFISVCNQIIEKRINVKSLSPVQEELIWSLSSDIAAQKSLGDLLPLVNAMCAEKSTNFKEAIKLCNSALHRLSLSYRANLRDWVCDCVGDGKKRISLLTAVSFLASNFINDGHSPYFIIFKLRDRFLKAPIKRTGAATIAKFIESISRERREYIVVGRVRTGAGEIFSHVSGCSVVNLHDLPGHAQIALQEEWDDNPEWKLVKTKVMAADSLRAGEHLDERLSSLRSQIAIGGGGHDLKWAADCYVYTPRSVSGSFLEDAESPMLRLSEKPIAGRRLKAALTIPQTITAFDTKSAERLLGAVSTAAVAYDSRSPQTKLISIWSAFEILIGDPPEDSARITHFVRQIAPCICLRYHRRVISAVHDLLAIHYKKRYASINVLGRVGWSNNPQTWLIRIMTLDEYAEERQKLLSLVSDNPLALQRLFRVYKMYGKPVDTLASIRDHFNRVSWQLHRIYRARNDIVHAGKPPASIESFVRNETEYFRATLGAILKRSVKSPSPASIDQVLAEIGFEWQAMQLKLANVKNGPFDDTLLRGLFTAL